MQPRRTASEVTPVKDDTLIKDNLVCEALDKLIDECTLILGWCFSTPKVKDTKEKQRQVARTALAKMDIFCDQVDPVDPEDPVTPPEDPYVTSSDYFQPPLPRWDQSYSKSNPRISINLILFVSSVLVMPYFVI